MPAVTKTTLIFTSQTRTTPDAPNSRVAGWSESYWTSGDNFVDAENKAFKAPGGGLVLKRLGILSPQSRIVGYRIQAYDIQEEGLIPRGGVKVVKVGLPGVYPANGDIPGMSLLCRGGFVSPYGQSYRFALKGIPDSQVSMGEGLFGAGFRGELKKVLDYIGDNYGSVIDDLATLRQTRIASISTGGLVVPKTPPLLDLVADQLAKVTRSRNADGRGTGGIYRVSVINGDGSAQLIGWDRGPTTGGSIIRYQRVFAAHTKTKMAFVRVVPRKVGLPFGRYRGRAAPRA